MLENLDFACEPGQTTAIIGSTGSGKSTVVKLIERFYDVTCGSITVDGISLTVARVDGQSFAISAIPHTVSVTTLAHRRVGDPVNLETDVLGKYVEKLLQPLQAEAPPPSGITRDFLTRCGF